MIILLSIAPACRTAPHGGHRSDDTVVIILGPGGIGHWQVLERRALIGQCVENGTVVILALLPGVTAFPSTLLFLKQFHAVTFQDSVDDSAALDNLVWGISGQHPA